jgi:hypothetical protein
MNKMLLLTALLLFAGAAWAADDGGVAAQLFAPEKLHLDLSALGLGGSDPTSPASPNVSAGTYNPGKALLLSAIVPGAGQYYVGAKIRAAVYLGVEVLAWTGVIYYYNKGKSKEDDFMNFADAHFNEQTYRDYEYSLAQNPAHGDSGAFHGSFDDWTAMSWDVKIHYLPAGGFTHELPTANQRENDWSDKQQYYEMIGKYIHQFGFGWDDGIGDDPGTPFFDGGSPRSQHYMDMRYDSNQLLKNSAWGYNIALLNHLVSALDASFTVRAMNRNVTTQVGFRQIPYDTELAPAAGLNFNW